MCLGEDEPGGPTRCSGDALRRCQRAQLHAAEQHSTVMLLEREHQRLDTDLIQIADLEAALNGTLSPDREAVLIERAERFRAAEATRAAEFELEEALENAQTAWHERIAVADQEVDERRRQWQEAAERREAGWERPLETEQDRLARLREQYEQQCQATGQTPTADGLDEHIQSESLAEGSHEEYTADLCQGEYLKFAREQAVTTHRAHAETLDVDQLDAVLEERQSSDELRRLVADRDHARTELEAATEQWNDAKAAFAQREPDALVQMEQARERLHTAFTDYKLVAADLDHHKDVTAQYAAVLGEKDPRPEYTGSMLGAAALVGDYPADSREWHDARLTGWGGSDVAKVLGIAKYATRKEVIDSKLTPLTDREIADQLSSNESAVGAAPRGHAWEPVLARRFDAENPEVTVLRTKASWKGAEEWQNLNVDGVMVDPADSSRVVGPWEAKTSDRKDDWKSGIPDYYRPQLAQAMDVMGSDRGALTVAFDDGEVRTYWMGRNDPLDPTGQDQRTYADRKPELAQAWQQVKDARTAAAGPPPQPKKNNGQFKFIKEPGSDSSHKTNADTARQLAVYRGCSVTEAEDLIRGNLDKGMKADQAVRQAYRSYTPARDPDRRYVIVDFETNGNHAGKHQIIQTGFQVTDSTGNVLESANTCHDINPKAAPTVGTGMTEVHGIDYQQLSGTRPFHRSAERDRLAQLAADPNVTFVAHSANYELSYLRAHGIHTDRVLDTMNLSRKFDHDSHGAKLSDFTAAHGVRYENAHDAYADVDMTRRALFNFFNGQ